MMLDEVLASRIDNPGLGPAGSSQAGSGMQDNANIDSRVIDIVKRLIEFNGLDQ